MSETLFYNQHDVQTCFCQVWQGKQHINCHVRYIIIRNKLKIEDEEEENKRKKGLDTHSGFVY